MEHRKRVISITEDDPAVREGLQLIVERAGYDTEVHADSRHVLDATSLQPDIYIIDRQLSGVDGLEACRLLKAAPGTNHIPVIIISATPFVERLAKAAQADGFLEKPFRGAELLEMVRTCLEKTP